MQAWIALGSNLGERETTLSGAADRLAAYPAISVVRLSSRYQTQPVGVRAGTEYLNAAAELSTSLSAIELLDALQSVESQAGRVRGGHWGPRTLDLDLIFYGQEVIRLPRLVVPHPAGWYRRFVLDPLVEIAPDVVHPEKGLAVRALRERLLPRPLPIGFAGGSEVLRTELRHCIERNFSHVAVQADINWRADGSSCALLFWLGGSAVKNAASDETRRSSEMNFDELPLVPRIDATVGPLPVNDFVRSVLTAALG